MTTLVEFPDVSNHQAVFSLKGAVAVIAKASQGVDFTDPYYPVFRAQAKTLGIPFAAYHWLDTTDAVSQAHHAYSVVGPNVPLMIDDEQGSIVVPHTLAFINEYRRIGGLVTLEYAPPWLWRQSGRPDLRPIADAGLHFVSSNYSGTGLFDPYGGIVPTIGQYTDAQLFNGKRIDFNRFNGTVEQLSLVFTGGTDVPDFTPDNARDIAFTLLYGSDATAIHVKVEETRNDVRVIKERLAEPVSVPVDAATAIAGALAASPTFVQALGREIASSLVTHVKI